MRQTRHDDCSDAAQEAVGAQEDCVALLTALRERAQTLATCESLTAGLLAATIAGTPGASAVLRGGLITYATDLKASLAGVSEAILRNHGPVSAECAEAMAMGARRRVASDYGLSLTGVAGPQEQDGHPVGEVWLGIAGPGDDAARAVRMPWDAPARPELGGTANGGAANDAARRQEIRSAAVAFALRTLRSQLDAQSSQFPQ